MSNINTCVLIATKLLDNFNLLNANGNTTFSESNDLVVGLNQFLDNTGIERPIGMQFAGPVPVTDLMAHLSEEIISHVIKLEKMVKAIQQNVNPGQMELFADLMSALKTFISKNSGLFPVDSPNGSSGHSSN